MWHNGECLIWVNHFLLMEVSTLLAADAPDLVVGDRTVWRVRVSIGFLHQGRFPVGHD